LCKLRKLFTFVKFPKFFNHTPMEHKDVINQIAKMFMTYGIRNTSMDNIAQELGISKKTLYQWYPSKEILLDDIISQIISNISMKSHCDDLKHSSETAIDVILTVMKTIGEMGKSINPVFFWELKKIYPTQYMRLKEFRIKHIRTNIIDNLTRGIEEGIYRKNINIEIVASLYIRWIEFFPDMLQHNELKKYPIDVILKEIYQFHLFAIVNNKGRAILKQRLNTISDTASDASEMIDEDF